MGKIYGYARASRPTQDTKTQVAKIREQFPDADVREENYTGTTQDRPVWKELKKKLKKGTTCVFNEVSRMGRTGEEAYQEYMELYNGGVRLVFLKDSHCNTDSYSKAEKDAINIKIDSGDVDVDDLVTVIVKAINTFIKRKVKDDIFKAFEEAQHEVDRLHIRTSDAMRERGASNTYKTDDDGEYVLDEKGNKIVETYGSIARSKLGKTVTTKKSQKAKEVIKKHSKSFGGSLSDAECIALCGCSRNSYYKYKRELLRG